jgi:hypothetical protein
MREALDGVAAEAFVVPPGLVEVTLDRATGKRSSAESGCLETVIELIPSDAPEIPTCTARDHIRAALPWPLQRYPIERDGALRIPPDAAAALPHYGEKSFRLVGQGQALAFTAGGGGSIRLAWGPGDWSRYLAALPPTSADTIDLAWPYELNRSGRPIVVELPVDP